MSVFTLTQHFTPIKDLGTPTAVGSANSQNVLRIQGTVGAPVVYAGSSTSQTPVHIQTGPLT